MNIFSIVPIEMFMDARLSKNDHRVLGAILSWRNKNTNLCWPKRQQISERCNLPLSRISTITTRLVKLGWLKKEGKGGCSKASNYELIVPDIEATDFTKPKTVTEPETVAEIVKETVTKTATRIQHKVNINKKIKENTKEKTISTPSKKSDTELLYDFGLTDDDLISDFITHRKALRAPITKTVLNMFSREAKKAGITISDAIRISVERGWRGFNASWSWQDTQPRGNNEKHDCYSDEYWQAVANA